MNTNIETTFGGAFERLKKSFQAMNDNFDRCKERHAAEDVLIEQPLESWPPPVPAGFENDYFDDEMLALFDCKRLGRVLQKVFEQKEKAIWTTDLFIAISRQLNGKCQKSLLARITQAEFQDAQDYVASAEAKSVLPWTFLNLGGQS